MLDLLQSKNMSLFCMIFNGVFALHSFATGSWMLGFMGVAFALFCGRNYLAHP